MAMQAKQRWFLIGGLLILTLVAMYMLNDAEEENTIDTVVARPSKPTVLAIKSKSLAVSDALNESLPDLSHKAILTDDEAKGSVAKDATNKGADLFQPHAWYIPPPPPKVVVAEIVKPIPQAPPVPFIYMGKLENTAQGTLVFLTANNKVLSAYVGKDVNPVWRLDKEDANALYFTYIPLSLPKVLSKMAKATAAKNLAVADNAEEVSNEN
jgi:hypothetical protein